MAARNRVDRVSEALADSGLRMIEHKLAGLGFIYFPPRLGRIHGLLVHDGAADLRFALAHHLLEHRTLPFYAYSPSGEALYDSPREQDQAAAYVQDWD